MELTLMTPLLIVLLLFIVAAGRVTSARITVQEAAQNAARAATLSTGVTSGPSPSTEQAEAAASTATQKLPCRSLTVNVTDPRTTSTSNTSGQTAALAPAAIRVVTVRVTCTVDLGGLTGLGLPATTDISATATSPLDRYRSST